MAKDIIKAAESEGFVCTKAIPYKFDIATGGEILMWLPHEWYPHMVNDLGFSELCLSAQTLSEGEGLARLLHTWAVNDDVQFAGELSEVGVLGLHCDGVQYTSSMRAGGARSIIVGSMNVRSSCDRVRQKRQPLLLIRKSRLCTCGCQGFDTIQQIMEVLAWSMKCLTDGVAPSCRHDGQPWTAHDESSRTPALTVLPKAALLQVRGDWQWLEECFRLRSVMSDQFCWMCNATQKTPGPQHYHDFRPDAEHRNTLINHRQYLQSCAQERAQPSNLLRCPGTLLDHLAVDSMHAGDLGTFQDAVGSLFWIEVTHKGWYRNKRQGLATLNEDLNFYYSSRQDQNLSRVTPLSMTQIMSAKPGYPFLKAKAAQTRHLAEFCLTLAQRHRNGDAHRPAYAFKGNHRLAAESARHGDLLVALFTGFLEYNQACAAVPFSAMDCRAGMYKYLQTLKQLHDLWRIGVPEVSQKSLPFHIRPKAHACQHLVEEKVHAFGSPSTFWCYRDEDFIGAIKSIANKTLHPATLEVRLAEKLRILAALD